MDIMRYVAALQHDLQRAAEPGGPDAQAAAERLVYALEPAVRLTVMEALADAAAEITHELPGTSVEVHLRGRDPSFVVTGVGTQQPEPAEAPVEAGGDDGGFGYDSDEAVARITLRLPESLKTRAEELAASRGQSLNTWLVNAARAAATISVDLGSLPFGTPFGPGAPGRNRASNKRIQGWVR